MSDPSATLRAGSTRSGLLSTLLIRRRTHVAGDHVGKRSKVLLEGQVNSADWTIALLANDEFGAAFEVGIVLLVDLLAEDEHDDVGVLLNGARFSKVGELGAMIAATAFGGAA